MKMNLKIYALSLTLLSTLAFRLGDEVELKKFVNARSNPNFIKRSNIVKKLARGTTGAIVDYKKFSSGNYGLKIKIKSGKNATKSYWVYYNVKDPLLTIKSKNKEISPNEVNNKVLEQKDSEAKTEEDINSYVDPSEQALLDIAEVPNLINQSVDDLNQQITPDCPPESNIIKESSTEDIEIIDVNLDEQTKGPSKTAQIEVTTTTAEQYNESMSVAPFRATPTHTPTDYNLRNECISRNGNLGYQTCFKNSQINGFLLENYGPNSIVKELTYSNKRVYNFENMENAQSDMRLMIEDYPDDTNSHSTSNVYMFFPRKVLPSIKKEDDTLITTLANGEVVRFNAKTKEIISGVLDENKIVTHSNGSAQASNVKYTGEGVVIKASKNNGQPFGSDVSASGKIISDNTMATISKKGHSDCQISATTLWTLNTTSNQHSLKNEYATDEGLDKLLKEKCNFTIN